MSELKIAVIGGDKRYSYVADELACAGFDVSLHCLGGAGIDWRALSESRAVVLPMPATDGAGIVRTPLWKGEIDAEQLLARLPADAVVFAGMAGHDLTQTAERHGLPLVDYLEREELAVLNAVPTAEGALALAMARREETLFGTNVLITGMGRIASVLLKLLTAFGARVTVAARKPADRVWADIGGAIHSIPFEALADAAGRFDLVFNTVPHPVIDDTILAAMKRDCLVIDLASKPGGVDFLAADRIGIATEWALALPGKVAPITAAKAICTALLNLFDEMEML